MNKPSAQTRGTEPAAPSTSFWSSAGKALVAALKFAASVVAREIIHRWLDKEE